MLNQSLAAIKQTQTGKIAIEVLVILAGRNEDTSSQTIAIMLGICIGSGALVLDYILSIIFGCAFVRNHAEYA